MSQANLRIGSVIWKSVVCHTVTYFLAGVSAYLALDYQAKFSDPTYAGVIRPLGHPMVMAGPALQPLRGLLFGLVFYPLRSILFGKKNGWLTMWWMLLVLGILNTFGPSPCSIEGMIYSPLPFLDHLTGLPETVVQSLVLSGILCCWVNNPHKKWLSWVLHLMFVGAVGLPVLGLMVRQ